MLLTSFAPPVWSPAFRRLGRRIPPEGIPNGIFGVGSTDRRNPVGTSIFVSVILAVWFLAPAGSAGPSPNREKSTELASSAVSGSVQAVELDRAIDRVLSRSEFSWRTPRTKPEHGDKPGWFMSFVQSAFELVGGWIQTAARFGRKVFEWLVENFFNKLRPPPAAGDGGRGWMTSLPLLLYGLMALVAALLAIMVLRLWRQRHSRIEEEFATAIPAAPDLTDENLLADELPRECWLRLGQELMDCGELRLALRAFYLAALAHLGQREFIRIAPFKSNRDYETELRRRIHNQPEVVDAFAETVHVFDRVWYGLHEIAITDLHGFQAILQRIVAC